jgi:hypothetical protein
VLAQDILIKWAWTSSPIIHKESKMTYSFPQVSARLAGGLHREGSVGRRGTAAAESLSFIRCKGSGLPGSGIWGDEGSPWARTSFPHLSHPEAS